MEIHVSADRIIPAPADHVYALLRDYRQHHPRVLPPAFRNLQVEEGGIGEGTVISFEIAAGMGRILPFRMRIFEPEAMTLLERNENDGGSTLIVVEPVGDACRVRITTQGTGTLLERLFAPRFLRKLYQQELAMIERYAATQLPAAVPRTPSPSPAA